MLFHFGNGAMLPLLGQQVAAQAIADGGEQAAEGTVAVPPGTYGVFTGNGSSVLMLGVAGAIEPAIYNLQGLTLNSSARIRLTRRRCLTSG